MTDTDWSAVFAFIDAADGEDSSDGTDELPAETTEETVCEDAPEAGDESGAPADAES